MPLHGARNCGGSSRSAASRISATTLRAISGGGIDSSCSWPRSSVSRRGTSRRLVGGPVPHDVPAAVPGAQVVAGPRHRIAEELLAGRQAEAQPLESLRRQEPAPPQSARPPVRARPHSPRTAAAPRAGLRAHGGAETVGADQQVGGLRACRRQSAPSPRRRSATRRAGPCRGGRPPAEGPASASRTGGSRRSRSAARTCAAIMSPAASSTTRPLDRHAEVAAGIEARGRQARRSIAGGS